MPQKILILEGNTTLAKHYDRTLSKAGFECFVTGSSLTALSEFSLAHQHDSPFDLILIDCTFPDLGGMKTSNTIRNLEIEFSRMRRELIPPVPIIGLNTWTNFGELEARSAGMFGQVFAPCGREELLGVVERWKVLT